RGRPPGQPSAPAPSPARGARPPRAGPALTFTCCRATFTCPPRRTMTGPVGQPAEPAGDVLGHLLLSDAGPERVGVGERLAEQVQVLRVGQPVEVELVLAGRGAGEV